MKKFLCSLLFVQLFFFACKKDDVEPVPVPPPASYLRFSQAKLTTSPDLGTVKGIAIEANSKWKLSTPATGTDWLELDKTQGDGNDSLKVRILSKNTTGAKRSVIITGSLVNGKANPVQLTVEQEGSTPAVNVTVAWKKMLGGNGNDYPYAIVNSPDGGQVIAGRTSSAANGDVPVTKGSIDFWVVKLDNAGNIAWQKTMGGNGNEIATSIAVTPDGGYVIAGHTGSNNNGDVGTTNGGVDYWVVKTNSTGDILWKKVMGGNKDDIPNAITVTTEGNIVVAGQTLSSNTGDVLANHGSEDYWVIALNNADGNVKWQKVLGGNGSEKAKAIISSGDGSVIIGGETSSSSNGDVPASNGGNDFWLVKLDKNGNTIWSNCIGGAHAEELSSLAAGNDDNFFAAGTTSSNNTGDVGASKGYEDFWIVKLNAANGALVWQQVLGGNNSDYARSIAVSNTGQILVAGNTTSNNNGDVDGNKGAADFWLVRLNSDGIPVWKKVMGGDNDDMLYSVTAGADASYVAVGYTYSNNSGDVGSNHGNGDYWVIKLQE